MITGWLIFLMIFCLLMFGVCVIAAIINLIDGLYEVTIFQIAMALANVIYFTISCAVYLAIK